MDILNFSVGIEDLDLSAVGRYACFEQWRVAVGEASAAASFRPRHDELQLSLTVIDRQAASPPNLSKAGQNRAIVGHHFESFGSNYFSGRLGLLRLGPVRLNGSSEFSVARQLRGSVPADPDDRS